MSSGFSPWFVVMGAGAAILGAAGTILVQRLWPGPQPGDGWTVRWLREDGSESRVDFGNDEKGAVERAVQMTQRGMRDVEVIEIRSGRVIAVQRAGEGVRDVA